MYHPKGAGVCLGGHGTLQFPESRVLAFRVVADSGGNLPCNVSTFSGRRYASVAL